MKGVKLSIENKVFVIELHGQIRIGLPDDRNYLYAKNDSKAECISLTGYSGILEYLLNIAPRYEFVAKFDTPQTCEMQFDYDDYKDICTIILDDGQGCLLTTKGGGKSAFVYNEAGCLCARALPEDIKVPKSWNE